MQHLLILNLTDEQLQMLIDFAEAKKVEPGQLEPTIDYKDVVVTRLIEND